MLPDPIARVARALGVEKEVKDRLFATVRFADVLAGDPGGWIRLEAVPEGWWYTTLFAGNRFVTMMGTEQDRLAELRNNHFEVFLGALDRSRYIGPLLGDVSLSAPQWHTWPIFSGMLPQAEGQGWMAIGDAASSFAPSIRQRYDQYRRNRQPTYAMERRWPEAGFWQRRLQAVAAGR